MPYRKKLSGRDAIGDNTDMKLLHIGIAACSAEGAALCYRTICSEAPALIAPHAHPEISLHTPSFADYMALIYRADWAGVGEMMLASAHKLKQMGADFVICPDNTIHQALPLIEARSPLPWLHIADGVAAEADRCGFLRIAILGTRWLTESAVSPEKFAARALGARHPGLSGREAGHHVFMDVQLCGVPKS